jgi:hypothetical protein
MNSGKINGARITTECVSIISFALNGDREATCGDRPHLNRTALRSSPRAGSRYSERGLGSGLTTDDRPLVSSEGQPKNSSAMDRRRSHRVRGAVLQWRAVGSMLRMGPMDCHQLGQG